VCRIVSTFGVAASSVLAVLLEGAAGEAGGAAGVPVPPVLTVLWACCFTLNNRLPHVVQWPTCKWHVPST
jgi:hypothetical protein